MATLAAPAIDTTGATQPSSCTTVNVEHTSTEQVVHMNQAEPLVTPAVDQLANLSGGYAV